MEGEENVPRTSRQENSGDSMSEQVGRIIDESQEESIAKNSEAEEETREGEADIQQNPKKRMWEEDKEAAKEAARNKDEL